MDYSAIPEHMRDGARRYVEHGIMPGNFLTAVLENRLVGAFHRADEKNLAAMGDWAMWLFCELPGNAWGSPEKVRAWCRDVQEREQAEAPVA